ncbi:MAG: hypothetical protein VW576_03270, partial [Opitutae bacterium]
MLGLAGPLVGASLAGFAFLPFFGGVEFATLVPGSLPASSSPGRFGREGAAVGGGAAGAGFGEMAGIPGGGGGATGATE